MKYAMLLGLLWTGTIWAQDSRWNLGLPLGVPEGLGLETEFEHNSWLAFQAFYHMPTPIRVKTTVKSKKLVDRDGVIIRSPDIDLPFNVKLGPHWGMGARFQPWSRPLYFTLGLEERILQIDCLLQSHLEVIDSQSRGLTNTVFEASTATRTEQLLLRSTVGYRWAFGETDDYFVSLFSGFAKPLRAHSSIQTRVRVRNPEASNPANVDAQNLQEAEAQQERVIHQKVADLLRKFEGTTLPILGISVGKYL